MNTQRRAPTGAIVTPAKLAELRRLLDVLDERDMGALDPSLGEWMSRPLGRDMLATSILPAAGSVYVCLYSLEPAGLIVVERGRRAARVRALAVAADMRRRGIAGALLAEAIARAGERGLEYLWMQLPAEHLAAIRIAQSLGFRRVLPQYLRRQLTSLIPTLFPRARVAVHDAPPGDIAAWQAVESKAGDAWADVLLADELGSLVAPAAGRVLRVAVDGADVGCACVTGSASAPAVWLWLEPSVWGSQAEIACLRAALDSLGDVPAAIDLHLGSSGHLRASIALYKGLGFRIELNALQILARPLQAHVAPRRVR